MASRAERMTATGDQPFTLATDWIERSFAVPTDLAVIRDFVRTSRWRG